VPPKFGKNIFGQLLCKIRAFSGKNHVNFGNFVNFRANIFKNRVFFKIFFSEKNHVKFEHFVNFSDIMFRTKRSFPPLKLTELLRL